MADTDFNSYIESASEPADELEGDVKEAAAQELEVKVDDVPNSSGVKEDDGAEVVARLQREVTGQPEPNVKDDDSTDIPDAFTNACLTQGWTNEEIIEFASDLDDAALLSLIPELLDREDNKDDKQKDSELDKVQAKQEVKPKLPKESAKASADTVGRNNDSEELAAIKKELAELKKEIGETKNERTAREEAAMIQTVNQVFDEVSKDFEIFGKTDELLKYPAGPKKGQFVPTSPAMIARNEVWDKAHPFIEKGIPVKDAMDIALTWYKGANLEKDVHRKVIKDLKKHEKKLSAKRSGKETVKTYENEEERQAEVVREAARKAGIKGKYDI